MTKERVIARLHDGLGNQLFIYAAARAIADARGAELLLDARSGFMRDRKYGATCQLQKFAVRATMAPQELCYPPPFGRQIRDLQIALSQRLPLRYRYVIREDDFDAVTAGAPLRRLVRLEGYWQSERYFVSIADKIAEELKVASPLSPQSAELARRIADSNSVSLHVRQMHGAHHAFDRAPPPEIRQLPFSYYRDAMARLLPRVKDPVFFVFADKFEWIRKRWDFPWPVHYVDHNRGERSYEDIALMKLCRHFIIGNSTFSWWGAWFSRSAEKIVIAPDHRGAVPWGSEADLFPAGWEVLPVTSPGRADA